MNRRGFLRETLLALPAARAASGESLNFEEATLGDLARGFRDGRFTARGFARAIEVAARGVQHDVIGRTRATLEEAGALARLARASVPMKRSDLVVMAVVPFRS